MGWQNILVILIGILVAGAIVRRIVRTVRRKDGNVCSGCSKTECPHYKANQPKKDCHS